ncbi:PREDICTED: serum paraoxonase/lactonase 3-like [Amphimedon queenslandica]|uniref:Paraoxonase n=1 Tax=Amphimedon queenslandica TaxID=400682 RepID=A0AAN0IUX6_AMPQE|nr:PREDICTED: serum paraoxonase/lactonase 3-like [Amphimedon queenslandica]|eukprot:XP_011409611.2 PREDICTED: serum paraoxonase/lactonase 3-like [Amphimedon queenslandica]
MAACKLILFSLLAGFAAYAAYILIRYNTFGRVHEQLPGKCRTFKMNGSEDIIFLPNYNHSIVTSGVQLDVSVLKPFYGSLYAVDMNVDDPTPIPIKFEENYLEENPYFNPHGLSYWIDNENGDTLLYIVCHWMDHVDSVDVFLYNPNEFSVTFLKRVSHPLVHELNNIVAVSRHEFYATNWKYFNSKILSRLEQILQLPFNTIIYCNIKDKSCLTAATGLRSCNGINKSRNGKFIYATSSLGGELIAYKRLQDNKLEIAQTTHIPIYVDNLSVDIVTGDIWAAVLVKCLEMEEYFKNHSYPIPSQTLHITVNDELEFPFTNTKTEQIFQSTTHGAISTSLYVSSRRLLLLGTVHGDMHICHVNYLMY